MALDAAVDPNVLSYPVPIIVRERGAVVRRGGASLWTSSEVRSVLEREARWSLAFIHRARQSPALGVERSGVYTSGVGRGGVWTLALGGRARRNRSSVVRKNQCSVVTSTTSLGTPVLGP